MGTANLQTAYLNGQIIDASHINELTASLLQTVVGRDSIGEPAAGMDLGNLTYPWGTLYLTLLKSVNIQDAAILGNLSETITTDNLSTGSSIALTHPETSIIRLTKNTLVSIAMITSPLGGKHLTIINDTGNTITLKHLTGATAAQQINTGTAADLDIANGAVVVACYEGVGAKWRIVGGSGGGGSVNVITTKASPTLVGTGGITLGTLTTENIIYVKSTGGAVNVTNSPQISAPTKSGQKLKIVGVDGTDTIQLNNNANLSLRGPWLSDAGNILNLYADSALLWCEDNRSL